MEANNMAAMREALENLVYNIELRASVFDIFSIIDHKTLLDAKAALAAPPRNCDVGTAEEQTRRLRANCEKYKPSCKGCKFLTDTHHENCWLKWAQMPYEEGGAE